MKANKTTAEQKQNAKKQSAEQKTAEAKKPTTTINVNDFIACVTAKNIKHRFDEKKKRLCIVQKNKQSMHVYFTKKCIKIYLHKDAFEKDALKAATVLSKDLTGQFETVVSITYEQKPLFDSLLVKVETEAEQKQSKAEAKEAKTADAKKPQSTAKKQSKEAEQKQTAEADAKK